MKNFTKLLTLALFFVCFTTIAQHNDTLKIKRDDKGVITYGRFTPRNERTMDNGKTFLKEVLKVEQKEEFRLQKENTDKYGITHQRYQQYYNEVKVEGAEYLVHGKNRMIETINGNYRKIGVLSTSPQLTEQQALEKTLVYVGAEIYKWEDEGMEQFAKQNTNNPKATYYPKGELIITKDAIKDKGTWKLAWKFTISSLSPNNEQLIYIDALTGDVIGEVSLILDVNTPGTAQTMYSSGTQNITCDSFGEGFRLREIRNTVNIQTLDLQNTFNISNAVDFTNTNTNWTNGSWTGFIQDRQALDAHWGAEMVFDYWKTVHNRNSIDGNGIRILSGVHAGTNWDNAQWVGGANNHYMRYGDGSIFKPLVALDICAHEFGHGVNEFEANLGMSEGWDESDALNEGLSDIWGAVIENWAAPVKEMWLMGEELLGTGSFYNCIRNIQNPKSTMTAEGQHPDTYQGDFWRADGEPHFNSTVLSHWFYLLTEGSSATDGINDNDDTFSISGIGVESAAAIVYQAQINYLTSSSNYQDARLLTIQAAEDLFGENSVQSFTTCQSWFAVGVGNSNCTVAFDIAGNGVVCTSNTYTVTGLPPGASATWSVSPNLQIVSTTSNSVTVSTTSNSQSGTIFLNVNGSVSERDVWLGSPATPSKIFGPTLVNTGAIVHYSVGTVGGTSSYEWRLPYPYNTVSTFDYFDQNWELLSPANDTQISAFTGYGQISGYVQVWGKNECGDGGAKLLSVSHGSGDPGGGGIPFYGFSGDGNNAGFNIYPNPAINQLHIVFPDDMPKNIKLFNFQGLLIKSIAIKSNILDIDISILPNGIYFLEIQQGAVKVTEKVIVQH